MVFENFLEEDAILDALMRILAIRDGDIDMYNSVYQLFAFLDLRVLELRQKHLELNNWHFCCEDQVTLPQPFFDFE